MAAHSSTLAWKMLWTEEPGGLQSMGSLRVRHDWATSLSLFTFMHWRRKWQPIPVFLPRESQERGSLVGCHLWGRNRVRHDWSDLAAAAAVLTGEKDKASVGIWQGWCDGCDQLKLLKIDNPLTSNRPREGHSLFRKTWRLKRGWFWSLFCQQRKKDWRLSRQSTMLPSHLPVRLWVGN